MTMETSISTCSSSCLLKIRIEGGVLQVQKKQDQIAGSVAYSLPVNIQSLSRYMLTSYCHRPCHLGPKGLEDFFPCCAKPCKTHISRCQHFISPIMYIPTEYAQIFLFKFPNSKIYKTIYTGTPTGYPFWLFRVAAQRHGK